MWTRFGIMFLLSAWCHVCVTSASKPKVVIAGLFPMSHSIGDVGRGVLPAVNLAQEMVNRDTRILPHHDLALIPSDTQCDMAVATKFFFDMVDSNSTMVMVFGDACSSVSGPMAEISREWNVSLLSYADMDPALSDRKKYKNFYRTVPSDSDFNPARLALLKKFNWTQVGTIFQDVSKGSARYGHAHNHLVSLLERARMTVVKSVGFVDDPEPAILELKKKDVRIIIGNFDANMARLVFCHAYRNRMFGPKYQWIILGGYPDRWWEADTPTVPCTPGELNATLHGYISTDILPLSSRQKKTISGLTPAEYLAKYLSRNAGHYSKFHAYAFDGVWVIAKVVDSILRKLKHRGEGGVYDELFRGENISSALNDTNFRGVTGQIRFEGGDRIGSILFEQYQGGKMVHVGEYHRLKNRLRLKKTIIWRGRGPPLDRKLVTVEYRRVPSVVYYSISVLAGIGIVIAALFLLINIFFRKHRYIKMSSPNLNNVIIVGCVLTYVSVFLLGMDGGVLPDIDLRYICTARAWVLAVGFTLAFGAMFSKTWRVHAIFTNIKLNKKVIKDYKLLLLIFLLLVIDAAILVTWQILNPLYISTRNLTTVVKGELNIIPVVEYCKSDKMSIWLGIIYAYKGMLLVFGCFLAWETRQVSIPALNDSKYIGMSVYNVVIMCVCGAAVSSVINKQPTSSFVIISLFIIFCTTITLCLVFVPKMIELKRDPSGEERPIRAKLRKNKKQMSNDETHVDWHRKNNELLEENMKCRNIIADKVRLLRSLMEQLGEDTNTLDTHLGVKTPVHKKIVELRFADSSPSRRHSTDSSEVDDVGSAYSDSSGLTTTWGLGNHPGGHGVYLQRSRADTKETVSSCTDVTDLYGSDTVKRRSLKVTSVSGKRNSIEWEEDGDGEDFGGVYCGPPRVAVNKLTNSVKENGRAKTITEVHPLIHDFPSKSYMGAGTERYGTSGADIYSPFLDTDLINNITIKTGGPSTHPTPSAKLGGNRHLPDKKMPSSLMGNKRKLRKINFMFPHPESGFPQRALTIGVKSTSAATCVGKLHTDGRETITPSPGLSCDIIEHI